MLKEHIKYIRGNPEGYWFKAKLYGFGWVPARWQGWLTLAVFAAVVAWNFYRLDAASQVHGQEVMLKFIPQTLPILLLLLVICYLTGERPRWRWGKAEQENKEE